MVSHCPVFEPPCKYCVSSRFSLRFCPDYAMFWYLLPSHNIAMYFCIIKTVFIYRHLGKCRNAFSLVFASCSMSTLLFASLQCTGFHLIWPWGSPCFGFKLSYVLALVLQNVFSVPKNHVFGSPCLVLQCVCNPAIPRVLSLPWPRFSSSLPCLFLLALKVSYAQSCSALYS